MLDLTPAKAQQIQAKKCSAIIVHRMLAHTVAPYASDLTRKVVWYRVSALDAASHSEQLRFNDMWRDFKAAPQLEAIHSEGVVVDVQEIELRGYGHLRQNYGDTFHLRIRQNSGGEPNHFASTISCAYNVAGLSFELHTNGFLARSKHAVLAATLSSELDFDSPNVLLQAAEWLYHCDYEHLITNIWHPLSPQSSGGGSETEMMADDQPGCFATDETQKLRVYHFHHLFSRSKRRLMINLAAELGVTGGVVSGSPGYLIVNGMSSAVDLFTQRFDCFHWKHSELLKSTEVNLELPMFFNMVYEEFT